MYYFSVGVSDTPAITSMPSGRTHDRITLWSLPLVAALAYGISRSSQITLIISSGFLFSGLMFGPDLDIPSRQFQRWGWLRWLWIPYQQHLPHRSLLSHGPIIGTTLRLIYLGVWLGFFTLAGLSLTHSLGLTDWNWPTTLEIVHHTLRRYPQEGLALWLGLEAGAMSHSLSDWGGSAYQRLTRGN